jgi:hypothetical protein
MVYEHNFGFWDLDGPESAPSSSMCSAEALS